MKKTLLGILVLAAGIQSAMADHSYDRRRAYHEQLDRCHDGALVCIAHIFVDVLLDTARKPDGEPTPPYARKKLLEFYNGSDCATSLQARVTLNVGDVQFNAARCDEAAQKLNNPYIHCVKIDGEPVKLGGRYLQQACNMFVYE
jgi:hypothetical protein